MFELIDVTTGEVLDTVTYGSGVTYATGRAEDLVKARARRDGISEVAACGQLARGWTNGYRATRAEAR